MSDKIKGYNTGATSNIKTFSSFNNNLSTKNKAYIQSVSNNNNNSNVETLDLNINASQEQIEQSNNNQSSIDDSTKATTSSAKSVIVDFFKGVYDKVNTAISNISSFITRIIKKPSEEDMANLRVDPNYFKSIEALSGDYGIGQYVFVETYEYELDGVRYNIYDAQKIIKQAIRNGETPPIFLQVIPEENKAEYDKMCSKIKEYGYSEEDTLLIFNLICNAGCTYTSTCNEIFQQFSGNPELFKKVFGYDMYITDSKGNKKLNSELLLDLYLFLNDEKNGGHIFSNGKINNDSISYKVNPLNNPLGGPTIQSGNQVYLSSLPKDSNGNTIINEDGTIHIYNNDDAINKFLQSKNPYLNYTSTNYESFDFSENKDWINSEIESGTSFNLGIYYYENGSKTAPYANQIIHMNSENPDNNWNSTSWLSGGGHAVNVTGATDEGLVISSWGSKYTIQYEDLKMHYNCDISASKITWNLGDESK